jgi:hypothetical protein
MIGSQYRQAIPTKLSLEQFEQFVLPHLSRGRRGPAPTLALHTLFNYVLQILYTGCQWKALAIKMNARGLPEIHYQILQALWRKGGVVHKALFWAHTGERNRSIF